tara:strand:+ start:625 stop:2355 length:1731 start_codon:yes stop_codon:yes gene_type:complete
MKAIAWIIPLVWLPLFVNGANPLSPVATEAEPDPELEPVLTAEILADTIASPIRAVLKDTPYEPGALIELATQLYARAEFQPLWEQKIDDLATRLSRFAEREGVSPIGQASRDELMRALESTELAVPAADMATTVCVLDAGLRVRFGQVRPNELWAHWDRGDTPGSFDNETRLDDIHQQLNAWQTTGNGLEFDNLLTAFVPTHWIYRQLHAEWMVRKETAAAEQESFAPLPELEPGKYLRAGDGFASAALLAGRLKEEGFYDGETPESTVTKELSDALLLYQQAHNLKADGILGPDTHAALNRSPARKLELVHLNLQRARLMPDAPGKRYVMVNLPSGEVYGFNGPKLEVSMRVVFGKSGARSTPLFRETMRYVVFRPYWNVPDSILQGEILPKVARDPSYLSRNGYEIVRSFDWNARPLPLSRSTFWALKDGTLKIRQTPGRHNALGAVKFLFPNDHSVYLHDTPEDHLFSQSERDFSHGCIRLEKPAAFAEWVLGPQGWSKDRVAQAMRRGSRNSVTIEEPIPVYVTYFTAFPHPETKEIRHYFDIYGRDDYEAKLVKHRASGNQVLIAKPIAQ